MTIMATAVVETWEARTLTEARALAIGELLAEIWPKPGVTVRDRAEQQLALARDYTGPDAQAPRSFVVLDGERVAAHALIFPRTIGTSRGDMTIAALARVCSQPQRRGQGLGEAVVRAALEPVDSGSFPFSLFQTTIPVRPFYEKLGAAVLEAPIVNSLADEPAKNPFWHDVVMRYPAQGDWPAGAIDLRGPGY